MRTQGQTLVWGTQGVNRVRPAHGWFQQLHAWWVGHHATRQQSRLTSLNSCWDAQHESCTTLRADAARDMVAAQSNVSLATQLYGLL